MEIPSFNIEELIGLAAVLVVKVGTVVFIVILTVYMLRWYEKKDENSRNG